MQDATKCSVNPMHRRTIWLGRGWDTELEIQRILVSTNQGAALYTMPATKDN